jgi:hypothetical protein
MVAGFITAKVQAPVCDIIRILQDMYCKFHKFLGSRSSISFLFLNVLLQSPLVATVTFLVSKLIVAHGFIFLQMGGDVHKVTG